MIPLDDVLKTIIAEGASEGEQGMYAIASVIVNRAKRRSKTPQAIVNHHAKNAKGVDVWQFTGRARKDLDRFVASQGPEVLAAAQRAWQRAQQSPMPGVDHYLTTELYNDSTRRPSWSQAMGGLQAVGRHTFMDSRVPRQAAKPAKLPALAPPKPSPQRGTQHDQAMDRLYKMDRTMQQVFGTPMSPDELKQAHGKLKAAPAPKPMADPLLTPPKGMDFAVEGGLMNDASGDATQRVRQQWGIK